MNVLALALYAVFAAAAFGWRTWVQWRRTGDTGLRMSATPGSRLWWAKLGFIAAFLGLPLLTFLPIIAKDVFQQDVGLYTQMMTTSGSKSSKQCMRPSSTRTR